MVKKTVLISTALVLVISAFFAVYGAPAGNEPVTIKYWQYYFETKVNLMDKLIKNFEAKNHNIKVVQQTFPYDSYEQKLLTSFAAGTGPDVVNLYYGWVPKYVKARVLQPLPSKYFPVSQVEKDFAPLIKVNKFGSKYYTIPIAVRTLGLFWNKDIFKANGLDPEKPPQDLDELLAMAQKCTKRVNGKLEIEGLTFQPTGQLHSWYRPVLMEQFGQMPLSKNHKKVLWNASKNGYKAFEFLVDLSRKYKVGENNFFTDDATAFINGKAAIHIDGSYRLSAINKQAPNLNFGVAALPSYNKVRKSFGSFWTNGITQNVKGKQLEASAKFLQYLTSAPVMREWTEQIGEIGARVEFANDKDLLKNWQLAPFIQQLPVATSYFYVDETADRKAICDAIDQVLLNNVEPQKALDDATKKVQKLLDNYWKTK
jgi:multiple sugar transport system substrate-binding protein